MVKPEILECGHPESPHSDITRGYGTNKDGKRHCYACCAEHDKADMIATGRATLYLCGVDVPPEGSERGGMASQGPSMIPSQRPKVRRWYVKNWPGSLSFPVRHMRKGRHNMARSRYDVWFTGPDGTEWHGVQYGENTQILHCRRVKKA